MLLWAMLFWLCSTITCFSLNWHEMYTTTETEQLVSTVVRMLETWEQIHTLIKIYTLFFLRWHKNVVIHTGPAHIPLPKSPRIKGGAKTRGLQHSAPKPPMFNRSAQWPLHLCPVPLPLPFTLSHASRAPGLIWPAGVRSKYSYLWYDISFF